MKRFQIKTRAGQYTWLQVLTLVVSAVAYVMNNMLLVAVMVLLATIFGVAAMMLRIREAKQITHQQPRSRRR